MERVISWRSITDFTPRSGSLSRRDSVASSFSMLGGASAATLLSRRASLATNLAAISPGRPGSPDPAMALAFPQSCQARGPAGDDDDAYRSGSCSRWLSRASSFSRGGGTTPLAWQQSASAGDLSARRPAAPSPHPQQQRQEQAAAELQRVSGASWAPDADGPLAADVAEPSPRRDEDEPREASPPLRERSMAPAESIAERAARQRARLV